MTPDPQKFAYKVEASHPVSFDDDDNIKALDDASQIMISSKDFLSMGVWEGGIRYIVFVQCHLANLTDWILTTLSLHSQWLAPK